MIIWPAVIVVDRVRYPLWRTGARADDYCCRLRAEPPKGSNRLSFILKEENLNLFKFPP